VVTKLTAQQVRVLLALYNKQQPALVVPKYQFTTARSLKRIGLAYLDGTIRTGPFKLTTEGKDLAVRYCKDHLKLDCQECNKSDIQS
jgi:hypothetical protein